MTLSTPTITFVSDLDSTLTRNPPPTTPDMGMCAIAVKPNLERLGVLAYDIARQLGHVGSGESGGFGWGVSAPAAVAYLTADQIDHLVIYYAQTLIARHLNELVHLCQLASVNIWFVLDTTTPDRVVDFAADWGAETIDVETFRAGLPPGPFDTEGESQPATMSNEEVAHAPEDMLTFLATAKRTLSDHDYQQVHDQFTVAFEATVRMIASRETLDEEAIGEHLWELLGTSSSLGQLVSLVRGTQAASIRHGYLVRVDERRFLTRAVDISTSIDLTDDDWTLVGQRSLTHQGAIVALTSVGLDVATIAALEISDVARDGSTVTTNGQTIDLPSGARRLLFTYLLHMHLTRGPDTTHLIGTSLSSKPITFQGVARAISLITAATGIAFRGHREGWTSTADSWRQRWGIYVKQVTT